MIKTLTKVFAAAGLAAGLVTASHAGIILDSGHYHGFYSSGFFQDLLNSSRSNSSAPTSNILVVGSSTGGNANATLAGSLSGHTLSNYSAIWFQEGYADQVAGYEAALAGYAGSGRWLGFEAMYSTFYTDYVDPIVGFDINAYSVGGGGLCQDGGTTTAAGTAFGLAGNPPAVSCRVHGLFNESSMLAQGYTAFVTDGQNLASIVATGAGQVPAPGGLALLALGLGLIGLRRRA